jgi:hypothetical protein
MGTPVRVGRRRLRVVQTVPPHHKLAQLLLNMLPGRPAAPVRFEDLPDDTPPAAEQIGPPLVMAAWSVDAGAQAVERLVDVAGPIDQLGEAV